MTVLSMDERAWMLWFIGQWSLTGQHTSFPLETALYVEGVW